MRIFLVITMLLQFIGCATAPPVIDLSKSVFKAGLANQSERKQIGTLKIINKADDGKLVNTILESDTIFPIKPAVTTKETVEQDLKRFFEDTLIIDKTADQDITVTISKADSYWIWGGNAKIPFIGLALVNADYEFGVNLRVLFEIEKKGKVTASYLFDEKITIQDKAAAEEAIIRSYQRLIAEYRKRFFDELETRFLGRYL
jgi:hypothetical protein